MRISLKEVKGLKYEIQIPYSAKELIQIQEVIQPKEVNVGKWKGQDFNPL